jgi:hypothetical protein
MKLKLIIGNLVVFIKRQSKYSMLSGILSEQTLHLMLHNGKILKTFPEKDFADVIKDYAMNELFGHVSSVSICHHLYDIVDIEVVSFADKQWKITNTWNEYNCATKNCHSDDLFKEILWMMKRANSDFGVIKEEDYRHLRHIL